MKGLLVKDLRLAAEQKWLLGIMVICAMVCLFTMKDPTFIVGYTCIICATIGSTTCAYDEMNNGMSYIFTLPYSRKVYVAEKYLFSSVLALIAWIASSIVASIYVLCIQKSGIDMEFVATQVMFLIPIFLIPGIMIPIILKFGHARSRFVMFVLFGVVFAATGLLATFGSLSVSFVEDSNEVKVLTFGIEHLIKSTMLLVGGIGGSIALFIISMFVSMGLINKKEY